MMTKFIKNNKWTLLGVCLGAIAGYLYWSYIGCASGTCSITSSPIKSTLWGTVMGGLVGSMFHNKKKKST